MHFGGGGVPGLGPDRGVEVPEVVVPAEHQAAHEAGQGVEAVLVEVLPALRVPWAACGVLPRAATALVPAAPAWFGGAPERDPEAQTQGHLELRKERERERLW